MDLTDDETARIWAAFEKANLYAGYELYSTDTVKKQRPKLLKFIKVWEKLGIDEQEAIVCQLVYAITPEFDSDTGEGEISVDPSDLDVGLAAFRAAEYGRGTPGAPTRNPGFNAAVEEAVCVWEDRGNNVKRVNTWRDQDDGREPRPISDFVADAIVEVLPKEAIVEATGMKEPDRKKLLQSIDARLRARSRSVRPRA